MSAGRVVCGRCERPQVDCLCRWITPVRNEVAVLVLQHPLEARQAKGSARLLRLSLTGPCEVRVGDTFGPEVLAPPDRVPLLLYPAEPGAPAPALLPAAPQQRLLVVLDATWRKSRRMLHEQPWLRALPRFALDTPPPSRYAIRKAESAEQRSTLEATCLALQRLEAAPGRYDTLLRAFDGFVAQRRQWLPTPFRD